MNPPDSPDTFETLIAADAIAGRIESLADEIVARIGDSVVLVVVLKGAFMFGADLARALWRRGIAVDISFITLSSYGHGHRSRGEIAVRHDIEEDLAGRAVVLVDDIHDTGLTLDFARRHILALGVSAVLTCVLLDKPARRRVETPPDLVGFEVPDVFVVGYGIDYAERYRGLPHIGAVPVPGD